MSTRYEYYEISQVFPDSDGGGLRLVTEDDLDLIERKSLETFFTLYGRFADDDVMLADAIFDSNSFERCLEVYNRITGRGVVCNPIPGCTLQLPSAV